MKKTKKIIASLAISAMVATMMPFNAFAATGVTTDRLFGADRFQTAINVSDKFVSASTAILAPAANANLVDALAAAPLAGKNAPILLTANDTLTAATKAQLIKLGVTKVYVVGAISDAVLAEVNALPGVTAVALKGADRIATAAKINAELTAPVGTFVIGYYALADALSVASFAAANNYSIVVANPDGSLPASAKLAASNRYVVGGPTLVADIANSTRLAGADRFATNKKVLDTLAYSYDKVYVANGTQGHLVDSLVASSLAAKVAAPIVLTDTNIGGDAAAVAVAAKLANNAVVTALGGATVVTNATVGKVSGTTPVEGELSVTSVSAVSASDFKVVFNQAPADTSKVVFTVLNGTAPVTVSATWNAAKTEATLTSASKYVAGTFSVAVKNNATELGSSNVTVTEQKVAKIDITSTKLGVTTVAGVQSGYATYKILDQYGVDITKVALANNVTFQTGVGTIVATKGLITVTPAAGLNLLTFGGGIVITANDTNSGVSTTSNLAATSQIGTLSDITLKTLTNADGKVLTAGDATSVFYAEYEAKDLSGNPTTNYTMLKQGLIMTGNFLTSSSPNVTAELIQDPMDSAKGLIEVKATTAATQIDMPVVITAMTWTGKTSQINTTLKKQAEVNMVTLYAPSYSVASNESKVIPFSAVDQNGVAVTKYTELQPNVTLTGATWVLNNDGTASIKNTAVVNNGTTSVPAVISAVTKTGKYSSITINIQKAVVADTLSLDNKVLMSNLQAGGTTQKADFGWDNGGFSVKDQYGRAIDMTTAAASNYKIRVIPTTPTIIDATASGGGFLTTGATSITIEAKLPGTATVKFELLDAASNVVDTKSQTFTSVANEDIKDYSITQLESPIYIINGAASLAGMAVTDQEADFKANPKVYGKTASGASVKLKGTPVLGANSTSGDFLIYAGANGATFDGIKVVANSLADPAKTESSAFIIVTVMGADGFVHTVKTPIKSSTAKPAAASVDVKVKTEVAGIARDGDTVTLTPVGPATYASLLGTTLAKFDSTGTAGAQNVYFAPKDQYGTTAANMAQYVVIAKSFASGATAMSVASNGAITYGTPIAAGDYITVSATTTTGLIKTIKIQF